jgi:hypothetical protein
MSIFSGNDPWDEKKGAMRFEIDDEQALTMPAFIELIGVFNKNGTEP